jgi:hypothetical protein
MPDKREELAHAVETDFRKRGPIRFAVPEIYALDDASISGQVNNTGGSTGRNVAPHLNFASRSISILDDDPHEIHGAPVNSQLYGTECALLCARLYGVVVQAIVDSARAEKNHLRWLGRENFCAQTDCRNKQKQDQDNATGTIH